MPKSPTGFALVAKRITGWTSNLLATGIVLAAALVFGQQVLVWWATTPEEVFGTRDSSVRRFASPSFGDPRTPRQVGFGNLPLTLHRKSFHGDTEAVLAALRESCRAICDQGLVSHSHPDRFESEILTQMARLSPVDRAPGHWSMYELEGPLPMVVVVPDVERSPAPVGTAPVAGSRPVGDEDMQQREEPPASQIARKGTCVLTWGLAFPVDLQTLEWTLFTLVPTADTEMATPDRPFVPTPPRARRGMSLHTKGGGELLCLAGEGRPEEWLAFFDTWFTGRGWIASPNWRRIGDVWHRRFDHQQQDCEVQIVVEGRGPLSGMVMVTKQ